MDQHFKRSSNTTHSHTFPTIGLLCDAPVNQYSSNMWAGVRDAADAFGANLFYFAGGIPGWNSRYYREQANVLYDRISQASFDGLVIWGAQLAHVVGTEFIRTFCGWFQPLPIVSIGLELEDFPCIAVNNYQGVYDLMTHLIEIHDFRKIGYVHPWYDNLESQERYRGYREALRDYKISFDDRLVTGGAKAAFSYRGELLEHGHFGAHVLFEQRGLRPTYDIEAIVAGDDGIAMDVAQFVASQGMCIPEELALVGFNDIEEAQFHTPPLTTVRQSFYDQGWRATELLISLLQGKEIAPQVVISPQVIIRRSCGCLEPLVSQVEISQDSLIVKTQTSEKDCMSVEEHEVMLAAIAHPIPNDIAYLPPEWPARIVESFFADLRCEDGTSQEFVSTVERLLVQVMEAQADIRPWHHVLSALRRHIQPYLADVTQQLRAENLLHQARVVVGEIAERVQFVQTMSTFQLLNTLQATGLSLITTFDLPELMNFLAQELPRLGIPGGYVALYDDTENPAGQAHLILAYNATGRIDLHNQACIIQPGHVLPEHLLPQHELHSLVISALYFQKHQIGFVVFEAGQCDGLVYEVLRGEMSTALYGALLVQRVQEHSAELGRQKYLLDSFIENVPARIYFKNRDGQIIRANKAHAARHGFDDPAEELGKTDYDFLPPERARITAREEQQLLEARQSLLTYEYMFPLPDGQEGWSLVTKMPLRDEHDDIIGTFGISTDITQLKQTEHALERARQAAEEARQAAEAANQAKSEFLANISHELRTPLNAVLGYAQVLQRERQPSTEMLSEGLSIIQRSGEHLLTLINDILDLSKIEARKMELNATPVNLPALLNEIVAMIRMRAESKGIHVADEFAQNLPEGILTDETRLRQVLLNLLDNAVKFTEQGTVTFRAREIGELPCEIVEVEMPQSFDSVQDTSQIPPLKSHLLFEIEDTGIGIPVEHSESIFLPFEQVDDISVQSSGTGLGLTISQRIVELMGGTLQVSSTVGVGSKFSMELAFPKVSLAISQTPRRQRTLKGYLGPRQTVLIIDDHAYNRRILRKFLETLGFICVEAEHGEQGVALAQAHAFCLMLVDLVMPVMDGITFARKIREHPEWAETILVAISANAFKHQISECHQAGYNAFLAKPFSLQEIFSLLETHLPLDWVYEIPPENPSYDHSEYASDQSSIPPSHIIEHLYMFAQKGDFFGLQAELDRLYPQYQAYTVFFDKVRQFANHYQDLELLTFLERALTAQEPESLLHE